MILSIQLFLLNILHCLRKSSNGILMDCLLILNSIFEVKTDGLNAMLKFKQSQAGIYGTFSLQIEGTAISDKITLPPPKKEGLSSVYPLW